MNAQAAVKDQITVAICSYNAAHYLLNLLEKLIAQDCPMPFEILIVDNNSTDHTQALVLGFAPANGIPIRYVNEPEQGIAFARNRAIEESLSSRYLAFIDSDELPAPNWLKSALRQLGDEDIDCVGGKISIALPHRPAWLSDDLLPFYGEVDHSDRAFRITDAATPIWSGNIAYNTRVFRQGLRFDARYNRRGKGIGGGEDARMLDMCLARGFSLVYEPDMEILHLIPAEKIRRSYFLKLHYLSGKKAGLHEIPDFNRSILGVPPFMILQFMRHFLLAIDMAVKEQSGSLRQAMNASHALGSIWGKFLCWKNQPLKS